MPRRLIELKVVGDQVSARLVESDGIGSLDLVNIEYAALSYCWGSPEQAKFQTKLTRKTRPKMLSSIDTTATTPVIQDAIHVCKALNIRYLWVDAVCILQDEITDWTQQSAIMTTIFGNASITICPLSSRSCNEGFLAQVLSGLQLSFDSTIKREVRGHYTLRRSHFKDDFHRATLGDLGLGDLEMSSWQTRAWTFQEGNCSNFKIIFGERRIHIVTPQGMLTDGSDQVLSTARSTLADMKNGIYGKNLIVSNNQLYRYWENSVENFSSRQLTYRTDKFPALSGMASYYQEWLGDKLIAGLWERHLYRQLFWTKGKNKCDSLEELVETLCPLSSSWIAPSWSWASFDGYVEFSSYGFPVEELFTGHTSHCQALVPEISLYGGGGHSLGRLEAASLLVTSKVFSTKSSLVADVEEQAYLPNRQWKVQRDGERLRIAFELDWEDETDFDGHDLELLLLGSCLKKDECAYGESWSELDEPFSSADEAGGKTHVWGLVICPAPSDSRASRIGPRDYYRIGVFFFESGSNGSLGLFDTAQEATVRLL